MENEKRLIDANDLWTDIMMLPHNGDMISSDEVEQAIKEAPAVDAVEVGSDPTAAGGGNREGSEWQRSAGGEPALSGEGSAGYRNRAHGRWEQVQRWATKAKYRCSVCGREVMSAIKVNIEKYPYCHCGAKMRGDSE